MYYLAVNGERTGPYEASEVEQMLKQNAIGYETLFWKDGMLDWQSIGSQKHLFETSYQPPPQQQTYQEPQYQQPSYQQPQQPSANPNFASQPSFSQPLQAMPVQHVVHHHSINEEPEGALPMISLVSGIVLLCLMLLGLIPCFGWINWFVLFGGGISKILGWVTIFTVKNQQGRNKGIIGLVLTIIALFVGSIRLILGGGIC
jgi:GYF domain 2